MYQRFHRLAMLLCATMLMAMSIAYTANAQTPPPSPAPTGSPTATTETCTDFASLNAEAANPSKPGLLTNITTYIKNVVGNATKQLYTAFTGSSAYKNAVSAAITLMIVIFGVAFLIGVVQVSFGQVLIRLIKVGVILTLISPGGWQFFSDYAVKFFNDGTDELIGVVMEIGTGVPFTGKPFAQLDGLATVVLSPDMIIAILGSTFNTGPYGIMMGGLLSFGVVGLITMLIKGLQLYALTFVVRSLMLGVAPIFIVFLLFDKTKQLFSGWLNVMVFLSLQPILYFTFISFFLVMLTTATTNMMGGNELCWTQYKGVQGSQNKIAFWRFKDKDNNFATVDEFDWGGEISCRLNGGKHPKTGKPCKEFPLNIIDLLSFLILVYVAGKFSEVTRQISSEISNSFVNLDTQAKSELGKIGSAGGSTDANPTAGGQAKTTGRK